MEQIVAWIQANPVLDFFILVGIPSVIQVSKININPWSWLGKQVGKAINGDVMEKLDRMDKRIDDVERRQMTEENERLKREADACRRRILTASDEMRRNIDHSEEFFNQILLDLSFYENYCAKHPDYINQRASAAIDKIQKTYQKCVDNNSFL